MDNNSYEQIELIKDIIAEEQQPFLSEGINVKGQSYENKIISIALPETLEFAVTSTESTVKGQTAASSNKPAILSNGVKVMVPPFINEGDNIIVRIADRTYIERAK